MEPRPVLRHVKPAYPTRREFLVTGAAALTAAGISGCGLGAGASPLVAPIFAHGEGRGATGCIVVAPPVFLSEEEALQVVREELAKAGVTLGQGMPLPEVNVEYEDSERALMIAMLGGDNWMGEPPLIVSSSVDLDAVDNQQGVGVTIVTSEDCSRFRGPFWSTVSEYDTKGLAQTVADAVRTQARQKLCVGVFYDPLEAWNFGDEDDEQTDERAAEDFDSRFDRIKRTATEKSHAQLRRQVQDFVAWMEKNR